MKTILFLSAIVFTSFGYASDVTMIRHKVQSHETAWFLSQVFFGHGKHYPELLKMNGLKSPDDLKYDQEIIVIKPKFHPGQQGFTARYEQLKEERSQKLYRTHTRGIASEIGKETAKAVVIKDLSVQESKEKVELPFTPVKDPHKTPADQAREELEKY